ncbi:MAG TPA: c-type cytochrome [Acidobacteriaceae bacterium]|nr:c-type cytochrome [Acidobacteriaceae bacterium]
MNSRNSFVLSLLALVIVSAIGGVVLIRRGFRASSQPSALETAVARTLRDIAIPLHNRHDKNPLEPTPENLQDARELYVTRCAICHGIDGGGKTRLGLNLYPRVPDLRLAPTQKLTDGEIHYIIETGVQLTGMPAWGHPHRQPNANSWKLALYIRNLRPLTNQQKAQQTSTIASAHYVGSESCEKCHADIYARWKKTPMANVVRDPRTHPHAILADFSNAPSFVNFKPEQIAFVYGSIWKQNYFTKLGNEYYPLPAKWDIANRKWVPYLVKDGEDWWAPYYPPHDADHPTGPTCNGCHAVNYNIQTHTVTEWNVGCERCHGPGSEHIAHPSRGNILNESSMDSIAANDTCIQCHSQGQPLTNPIQGQYYDWPVGYQVGKKLQDFWKLQDHTLGQQTFYYFAEGTAHKNRMQGNDFVQSVMYRHRITCASCHDVHGTPNYAELRKPANLICMDCHGPMSPNGPHDATIEQHTHHKPGTPGSECVACHMPKIETEGVPGQFVHAHTFKFITPDMTDKYKISNPCTSCHAGKSTEWATNALRQWPGRSPWRME